MKFGLSIPQFEHFADVRRLADLASDAERAGWDGFFVWDHILFDNLWRPMVDPWIALAAIAMRTNSIAPFTSKPKPANLSGAPINISNSMAVFFLALASEIRIFCPFNFLLTSPSTNAPKAPTPAASVGVNIPA